MWILKNITKYNRVTITEKKQSHRYKEQASGYRGDRAGGGATDRQGSKRHKLLGMHKLPGYLVQHEEYSKYFVVTIYGVKPLQIVNHRLPWWLRVKKKKSTCQCRMHGFNSWSGKIPLATGQLRPWAATTEPTCCSYWNLCALEPVLCNKRSHCSEKPPHHAQRAAPHHSQRRARAAVKTQHSQK